ncbi:MAG: exopolyphosphatase [Flavobacteriales bacterium]|nr:exopolyphosphatase [Flavobacteriales bacterium]
MRFGAIDIGSNAVRLLIADVFEDEENVRIKKLSLTRVPIRLGSSVFETGEISSSKAKRLAKTMKAFRYLLDVYNVKGYKACATSAMREASNSDDVIARVKYYSGVEINIIDGSTEADLIFSTFKTQKLDPAGKYLYIDVGGGSTEITLLKNGGRVHARSFKVGTVRVLKNSVKPSAWQEMEDWVASITQDEKDLIAIGTGGNINRLYKISRRKYGELMGINELKEMHELIKSLDFNERMIRLNLRSDRADVIVPAGEIYCRVMDVAKAEHISVPKVGLSDGIALYLYREYVKEHPLV